MRDERTRLTVALEFSKEEKNHLDKQNKELKEKAGKSTSNSKLQIFALTNTIFRIRTL